MNKPIELKIAIYDEREHKQHETIISGRIAKGFLMLLERPVRGCEVGHLVDRCGPSIFQDLRNVGLHTRQTHEVDRDGKRARCLAFLDSDLEVEVKAVMGGPDVR